MFFFLVFMSIDLFDFLLKDNIVINQSDFAVINNQQYISELIEEIYNSHKSITVLLETTKKSFKSFISNIDLTNEIKQFETEYITFLNLYKSRFASSNIAVVFYFNDIYYGFKGVFIKFTQKNEIVFEIPDKIFKLQRRKYVRVNQSVLKPIDIQIAPYFREDQKDKFTEFIGFWQKEKDLLKTSLIDISEGGIGVIIETANEQLNEITLPIFRIKLLFTDIIIETIGQIVSIIILAKTKYSIKYRIGISFRNISKDDQNEIKKYVMDRQTEILRNRKDK